MATGFAKDVGDCWIRASAIRLPPALASYDTSALQDAGLRQQPGGPLAFADQVIERARRSAQQHTVFLRQILLRHESNQAPQAPPADIDAEKRVSFNGP